MATELTTPNNNHGKRTLFQNVKYQYLAVLVGECTHFCLCLVILLCYRRKSPCHYYSIILQFCLFNL